MPSVIYHIVLLAIAYGAYFKVIKTSPLGGVGVGG